LVLLFLLTTWNCFLRDLSSQYQAVQLRGGTSLVIQFAFDQLELHRLEANIQPDNASSLNLVKRLGFKREGYSAAFQFINDEWRDHERWALTAETAQASNHRIGN
ncbi:GNAT family N-acetyltransferase, partial [Streptomyces sp. NPDC058287]|uniref:GNAT family N-acetyltransferase n=1 Tax=unclassified Streptomyces TaxID=2593676 RepID=UPI0036EC7662